MRIVFHGTNAATFVPGFADLIGPGHDVVLVPDRPETEAERAAIAEAEVLVGIKLDASHPRPERLRLYQAPAAGIDGIDRRLLPPGVPLCNAPGHEQAIAEFVFAALLPRFHPIPAADRDLRQGKWTYWAVLPGTVREEIGDRTMGLLGYGHIGKAVGKLAKAFGMRVTVANRSPVPTGPDVDESYSLDALGAFMASADLVVASLPLTSDTEGLVGAAALAAMRPDGVIVNVGRGPVIQEVALYEALAGRRIGGAVIDTWYQYPAPGEPQGRPSRYPFHDLDNIVMTSHMSGWTHGTVRRRRQVIAGNVGRLERGEPLVNVV
jgi:phosphoglycerate dehydrogenase-like enzyme